jgi:hypothetical protein
VDLLGAVLKTLLLVSPGAEIQKTNAYLVAKMFIGFADHNRVANPDGMTALMIKMDAVMG